jgi:hypothetical protein
VLSLSRVKHLWLSLRFLSLSLLIGACVAPIDESADPDQVTADITDAVEVADSDADLAVEDPFAGLVPVHASAIAITPGCVAHAPLAGHSSWFFFSRPDRPCQGTTRGTDPNATNELVRLIHSVPAGGRIDGHIYSINIEAVAAALLAAQVIRRVDVRISTNGKFKISGNPLKTKYIDKLFHKSYCHSATNEACIGTAPDAISHTKLFTFSTTMAPDGRISNNVVWFGSANQTVESGQKLYNNTVTIYGDATLYNKMRSYLGDLFAQRHNADYYVPASGRGHFLASAADVYASPELQTDLVVNRLDDITADSSCLMQVMQASIHDSRMDVVNKLVQMKRKLCRISIVAHTVDPRALAALKAAGIPVRRGQIHDKTFIVFARFAGRLERRVYTGSHNLGSGAAHRFDEIFVKLAPELGTAHPIYDAYVTHFNDAFNIGASF